MPLESPTFPQSVWPYISHALAIILTSVCTFFVSRKKDSAEVRKLNAESSHIEVLDQLAIIESVTNAAREVAATTARAERLFQERQHWERKAEDYYLRLESLQFEYDQQGTVLRMAEHDVEKQRLLLTLHKIPYSDADKV